jgi:hypothetical protein
MNFKSTTNFAETSISAQSPHLDYSVNQRPLSGTTKSGAKVTTSHFALPCHKTATTDTTTTSIPTAPPHSKTTLNTFEVPITMATELSPQQTLLVQTGAALAVASCDCENQSKNWFMNPMKVSWQEKDGLEKGKRGVEETE